MLGGLADYASRPADIAVDVEAGQLRALPAPLASDRVATIVGFTEAGRGGRLYNSAAVFRRGPVVGLYRKLYPAINRSGYEAGDGMPVFTVGTLMTEEPGGLKRPAVGGLTSHPGADPAVTEEEVTPRARRASP